MTLLMDAALSPEPPQVKQPGNRKRLQGRAACGLTPAAAGLSMYLMSGLKALESEDAWRRQCDRRPSTASLVRRPGEVGTCVEACSETLLEDHREREELAAERVSVLVSLDGVMMRMSAEGNMLESRCFGRLPETGKASLKSQLKAGAFRWRAHNPDLKLAAVAESAKDTWPFLESLSPDVTLADLWHGARHLGAAAAVAFGPDEALRAELGPRRQPGRPDRPRASRIRALRPGVGRAGSATWPRRRLETTGMRQRNRAGGAGRARRVIRERNIMK
ncbi:MAG: hypothetical protein F4Y68_19935 [Boseongicola sp. SB0665_bin_10]|nr:hypothetical protein [Boseongicola sp. SB0665_bin_10]